ncbi:T9SS type A sorting domain-containing protein [Hymenobacter sp. 5317J-9]|uniref:T9SS type A sorting domain-containing protein n=1 Tax=Hymenobacter sp. 5317J-9 TaxID=2932250 RepID=UPI001FD6BAD7|nr:T9SS type A sorting domain-containing protein [Hymenobacter sp. 5317J-9]UOQ98434.1 T9SS type A sorting domain-containing protein [Hymenobacter sp. 5317J-9]
MTFNVLSPTTLTGVYVYPTAAGVSNIQLLNSAGTVLQAYQATFTAADLNVKTFVPLNFSLLAGTGLRLSMTSTGSTASLYRNTAGAVYPYTSPSGNVSITGNTFDPVYYYYFYDWRLGSECVSGATRTPIQVNVTAGLVASLAATAATSCGTAPVALSGSIAGTATGATYTSTGTGTFSPNATTLNATYTPSAADVAAGTVTITLTPTGPAASCTKTAQFVLTLTAPPASGFSYPAGTYCTGANATIAPVLAPGAQAGTFTASGFGLRIDPVSGIINLANTNIDGTFTITNSVSVTGACSGASSSTTTVTINPGVAQPTLTATPQAGGAVLLSTPALVGATYQFFKGTPAVAVGPPSSANTLLLAAGTQSGAYTVVVTSTTGCSSIPSAPVSVVVTGTQTATLNGVSLRVFPNPTADGRLRVELSGINAKASQLRVFNALGQVVHAGSLAVGTESLNLSKLAAGVYTLRVQTAEGVLTQRIVRE